jgi:hypothetical protein
MSSGQVPREHRSGYPPQTPDELQARQGSHDISLRFNMAPNQQVMPPQPGEVNPLLDQNPRGQQPASMGFVDARGNTMGTYQFNPGSNPASSNVVYTTNDAMAMQQFPHSRALYHNAERFNLDPNYDPASFAASVNPMTAFQHHYSGAINFQGSDMAFELAYENQAAAQTQSLDMLFSNPSYVPLPQSSMQPASASGQLTPSLGGPQQDWPDMSNFNLSLSGQNLHDAPPPVVPSSEHSLVALPQNTGSTRSQSISSYLPPKPSPTTANQPTFRNPFIPPGKCLFMMVRLDVMLILLLPQKLRRQQHPGPEQAKSRLNI